MARNFGAGTGHTAISAGVARCDERLKNCQSSAFKVERNDGAQCYEKLIHGLTHVKGLGRDGRHNASRAKGSIYLIYSITLQ